MAQATQAITDPQQTTTDTDEQARDACPECAGRVRPDRTEHVCEDCGLVVDDDRLDRGPEWRTFDDTGTSGLKRCNGGPVTETHHLGGHHTVIGERDAYGNTLPAAKRRQLHRLRRQQNWTLHATKLEKNRAIGLGEIRRAAAELDVPAQTRDRAARLFKDAHDAGLLQGRSIEAFAAGALYAACREDRVVRTLADIATASQCSKSDAKLCYGVMNQELGLAAPPMRPRELVGRLTSALDLPAEQRAAAHDRAVEAENAGLHTGGRRPSSVAAAAVYDAVPGVTQQEVADAADTTPVTVRKTWKALQAARND